MLKKEQKTKVLMVLRANYIKKGGLNMSLINVTEKDLNDELKTQKQKIVDKIKNMDSFLLFKENPEIQEYKSNVQYLKEKDSSPEMIEQKAQNMLQPKKYADIQSINEKVDSQLNALDDQSNKTKQAYEEAVEKDKKTYDRALEKTKQKLANQGLGRSSIIDENVADVEKEEQAHLLALKKDADNKILDLENKKQDLERQRDEYLSNFEIEYAVKLQEKIDELTKDVNAYNEKVIKYNNALKEKEEKNALAYKKHAQQEISDNEKRNQELVRFLDKYGYGNYSSFAQKQKVQIVQEFLNSLDKQSALSVLLEDDDFKSLIGESAFNSLLQQVQERED